MVVVMMVAAVVNALLLQATGLLLTDKPNLLGILCGSLFWGILASLSMLPELSFLGSNFVRLCCMLLNALLAFGFRISSVRNVLVFAVLHLSVTGMAQTAKLPYFVLCLLAISAACMFGQNKETLVPVELSYRGKTISLTALRDTGNTLHDPITGRQVLIVGADIAGKLTGLTRDDLRDPVATMGAIPGLRLIPYQTIGNTGFLLAMKITDAKIGKRQGSTIVAFSPLELGSKYQALTGGTV